MNDFTAFRELVFSDVRLRQRLLDCATIDVLTARAVSEGAARGLEFSSAAINAQVNTARKDWLEQWIAAPVSADTIEPSPANRVGHSKDFTGWLPIRLFVRDATLWVDWCYSGTRRLQAAFFSGDVASLLAVPFNLAFRRYTPIDSLLKWAAVLRAGREYAVLKAVIAHVSRCGSTLVTQMLAELPTHRVLSEPSMLDVLLNIRRRQPQITRERQIEWLRALMIVLGHGATGETALALKLDAWHILEIELLQAAFPSAAFVFLFRDPQAVAVSHALQPTSYMIPGASNCMPWLPPNDAEIWNSGERYMAAVLGKIYEAGAAACDAGLARAVDYRCLPEIVCHELAETFGVPSETAATAALTHRAFKHAKRGNEVFDAVADSARSEGASATLRNAVSERCAASYARLEAAAQSFKIGQAS